jgi:hypothetical protein
VLAGDGVDETAREGEARMRRGQRRGDVLEEVSATEYRALRWHASDLAAGAKTTVTARTMLALAGNN